MPLYPKKIVEEFESKKEDFRAESMKDKSLIGKYGKALEEFKQDYSFEEITTKLGKYDYPGAMPSLEFKDYNSIVVPFKNSCKWESHESVNNWAKEKIEEKTTIGVDGSQINSTPEFDRPLGFVQVACLKKLHTKDGSYERDVDIEVLTPSDLLTNDGDSNFVRIDEQKVHIRRFEKETGLIRKKIKDEKEEDPPPVLFYDGSLLVWFIEHLDPLKKERYGDAMAKMLAASKEYKVPVIGYIGGSNATEIKSTLQNLDLISKHKNFLIHDYQIIHPLMKNWGDRTILFNSLKSSTLNRLKVSFEGRNYDFSRDIMFTYLKTGRGTQLDRIEMPRWIYEDDMIDYVMDIIRGECCMGRGYPEILQQADADAVINGEDRKNFLKIYQKFAEENDIELRWNNKTKSKKRRRR